MKEVENGSKPGLDCTFMFEMFFWTVVARVCIEGSSYTGACSLLRWKVVFMFLYLPPGPGGTEMSEGETCPDRNWSLSSWCRVGKLDLLGSTSGTLSCGCTKCDWRCSVHDSAEIGEMSNRLIAVISSYTSGLQASMSPTISYAFFFPPSACSRQSIDVAAQQKVGCVVFSIWYVFCNHGTLRNTKETWEGPAAICATFVLLSYQWHQQQA